MWRLHGICWKKGFRNELGATEDLGKGWLRGSVSIFVVVQKYALIQSGRVPNSLQQKSPS